MMKMPVAVGMKLEWPKSASENNNITKWPERASGKRKCKRPVRASCVLRGFPKNRCRIGSDSPVGGDQTRLETCDRYVIEVPDCEEAVDPRQLPLRKFEQVKWN